MRHNLVKDLFGAVLLVLTALLYFDGVVHGAETETADTPSAMVAPR